jgi:tRNA(His) guanylyltransferase
MKSDDFGDHLKSIEQIEAGRKLLPLLPIIVRLDGKAFHTFTKGLTRPYDESFIKIMALTTAYLVEESNARLGFCQSDEISLILYSDTYDSQLFFDGKIQKLVSVLASITTAKFNSLIPEHLPSKIGKLAIFDCRVWNVPNKTEAANTILWRCLDARKNSISMLAQHYYSHKELNGKTSSDKLQMLEEKGVIWGNEPSKFKQGSFFQRHKRLVTLSDEELARIPEKFRPLKGEKVERSSVIEVFIPPFNRVANREEVIFDGAGPRLAVVESLK